MRLIGLVLNVALSVVIAACGGAGATASNGAGAPSSPSARPTAFSSAGATGSPQAGAASSPSAGASTSVQIVSVSLTDALRIEPAAMTVKAGQPVRFVVTNVGVLAHEFYLGDAAAQVEHEAEMAATGGDIPYDGESGIAVQPGQTRVLEFTFESTVEWKAGCHVTSHYAGGMVATITVTE